MSGHSKWSTIKRQKGVVDARRSQLFTKLAREIMVAARQGGSDPEMNVRLRLAAQKAKESNMPNDNVDRAIKRGAGVGEDGQASLEEVVYEGYGPGGAAILLEGLTDKAIRTVSEVRNVFQKAGGNLGEKGCVAWNFESQGIVAVEASGEWTKELALLAIDAGAEDFEQYDDLLEIRTQPDAYEAVRRALEEAGADLVRAEIAMVPKTTLVLETDNGHRAQPAASRSRASRSM